MKTRWNLPKAEQGANSENAERLKSGGVTIGAWNAASQVPSQLRIWQSENSFIHAGRKAGMLLEAYVRLMALKPGITVCDYEITIPGCDGASFELVPTPDRSLSYKTFGWIDTETSAVVNHLLLDGRPLPNVSDGFLIARSFDWVPGRFQQGMRIDATIRLVDQFGSCESSVELIVQRHDQRTERPRRYEGLFAPKQCFGTRYQCREDPAGVIGTTVSGVERKAGGLFSPK